MTCQEDKYCDYLIDPSTYDPDTLDLQRDEEARKYWIQCFHDLVKKFAVQAGRSQPGDASASERAESFSSDFSRQIDYLNENTNSDEPLTIRRFLELNESCLRVHGFADPWHKEKRIENAASLMRLRGRLDELDALPWKEKWIGLVRGVLAGNIFDWGAQAVSEILENDLNFGLDDALKCIQQRPWLVDGLDAWLQRLQGPPHKCAAIFVDNSGVDIVLGVLPFARELVGRGTKVLLCANTQPSLNDITVLELEEVVRRCCQECQIMRNAYDHDELLIYGNGQMGPCLDFRTVPIELCEAIAKHETDLLVIEGMGRALHTNLNAKFKCETLKLAVVKNKWLANRLGGDTFSVICKYEQVAV